MTSFSQEALLVRAALEAEGLETIEHNAEDFSYEDMIPNEEVIITVSHQGYIKRTALTEYRSQGRGGVGSRGAITKEDDWTEYLFTASTHNYLLIFTDLGKLFWLKTFPWPGAVWASGWTALVLLSKTVTVPTVCIT